MEKIEQRITQKEQERYGAYGHTTGKSQAS